jgi:uncharacterized protein (UPF0303 family)
VFRRHAKKAWRLGVHLVEAAQARWLPLVAVPVRRNGQRLFHAPLEDATADNDAWVGRNSAVVDRDGHFSYLVGMRF